MSEPSTQSVNAKPHISAVPKTAATAGKNETCTSFGMKWKELVLPVPAFRIKLWPSITNVVSDDITNPTMRNQLKLHESAHIFQLLDSELITKLEAHVGSEFIHAIRFQTTMRVSLWLGSAKVEVKELSAPEGCVIRSLYGAWGRLLREIGAVFVPVVIISPLTGIQPALKRLE